MGRADIGCSLFVLLSLHFYDNYLRCIYTTNRPVDRPVDRPVNRQLPSTKSVTKANFQPLSDLNGRGRTEFKARRLMQSPVYLDRANGSSPVNAASQRDLQKSLQCAVHGNLAADLRNSPNLLLAWSTGGHIQLYLAIICATISVGWKEYGVTVFAICALYHLIVHCSRLAGRSKRLVSLNVSRRRWQTTASKPTGKPAAGRPKEYKLSAPPQSGELCQFRAFLRCLRTILNNVSQCFENFDTII